MTDWYEVVWTVVAFLGLLGQGASFLDAAPAWLAFQKNGIRRRIAAMHLRSAVLLGLVEAVFLVVGIMSMLRPPPVEPDSIAREVILILFIGAALVLGIKPWLDLHDRHQIERLLEARSGEVS